MRSCLLRAFASSRELLIWTCSATCASSITHDSLYRYADEAEIHEKVKRWLETTIANLKQHRAILQHSDTIATPGEDGCSAAALHESAKCANPACSVAFDWRKGGKFFRFRESSDQTAQSKAGLPPAGIHGVRHYWLCERCSHLFTLAYGEHAGVVLKISWPTLIAKDKTKASAA